MVLPSSRIGDIPEKDEGGVECGYEEEEDDDEADDAEDDDDDETEDEETEDKSTANLVRRREVERGSTSTKVK